MQAKILFADSLQKRLKRVSPAALSLCADTPKT
jgi:hypothetical protein